MLFYSIARYIFLQNRTEQNRTEAVLRIHMYFDFPALPKGKRNISEANEEMIVIKKKKPLATLRTF